jgi:hypothetical protein
MSGDDPSAMGSTTTHTLLRIRSSSMKQTGLSPFEVLYGCPPPLKPGHMGGPHLEATDTGRWVDSFRDQ